MNILEVFIKTLETPQINTAIIASLAIILLGYACRKRGIFDATTGKTLTKVVLTLSLPALAYNAFMSDINPETFNNGMGLLIWGILMYPILIALTIPIYKNYQGDEKTALRVLSILGSTTFFGIPIVTAIYGPQGTLYASIFNIGYRIFLYSYGYIKMSGLPMKKENIKQMFLNPIVLATFFGLFVWITQAHLPQVMVMTEVDGQMVEKSVAFLRIDHTLPQLYQIFKYLGGLASPLAWLAIGSTLGAVSFKEAFSDQKTWYYTLVKLLFIPAINIAILFVLSLFNFPISLIGLGTVVIMMATPPATVAVAYAISFDRDALLASNASLLSTLGAVIMAPIWIVIIELIGQFGWFV
ncbi:AEC family transporter [Atopobacter phocae]|uniref:AEC family transporter n=1 Tax=Atopobacter phocae TaxID=136492 RepID=UPI000470D76D|nr:AEC family transporter [Atopobacter phocae]